MRDALRRMKKCIAPGILRRANMTARQILPPPFNSMISCRFDNSIDGISTVFEGFHKKIEITGFSDLPAAFAAIEEMQKQGRWIALIIPYTLGEFLDPHLRSSAKPLSGEPLLTALVFEECKKSELPKASHEDSDQAFPPKPLISFDIYEQSVKKIIQWLQAGNVYQINYTLPVAVDLKADPVDFYLRTIHQHPTKFAAHIRMEEMEILSFSPELFIRKKGHSISTKPMKGTAPRCASPDEDRASYSSLLHSAKNRAENAMIVDLLRNDMGKLASPGTVKVDKLFEIEKYPSIWTMTSTIGADIGNASLADILGAMFPCGSVTGAPKIAAMKCIRELEPHPRGVYCGSIGWLAPNGDMALNVAIRTLVLENGKGIYGVGGGIVLDSDPREEWLECQWKTRIISDDFSNWR